MNTSDKVLRQNLKTKLKDWIIDSTSHGFPKIFKNDRISLKLVWTICIVLSIGACCYFVINTLTNFTKFEVTTLVRRRTEIPLELPAISICHNEMFLTPQGHYFKDQFINSSNIGNILNSTFLFQVMPSIYQASINIDTFDYFAKIFASDYNISDQVKKSLGFNLDSYMLSCFLSTQDCDSDSFIWYFEQMFGNCYLFNTGKSANGSNKEIYKQTNVGADYGLRFEFLSRSIDQVNKLNSLNGIHIALFDPSTRVNPHRGIDLPSKYKTNINIRKRVIKKIPYPYSECLDDHSKFHSSEIYQATTKQGRSYSQTLCFDLCFQSRLISKCNCADPNRSFLKLVPTCLSYSESICVSKIFRDFYSNSDVKKECANDCPLECEITEYDYKISYSDYPTDLRADALVELLKKKDSSKNYSLDFVKQNSLKFDIFYDSLEYEEIQELKKMEIVDLVASVGGLLGLFIGISVLSFAEIIEILVLIFCELLAIRNKQNVITVKPLNLK